MRAIIACEKHNFFLFSPYRTLMRKLQGGKNTCNMQNISLGVSRRQNKHFFLEVVPLSDFVPLANTLAVNDSWFSPLTQRNEESM